MILPYSQHRQTWKLFASTCALNKLFSVELVNGIDDVVNTTLEVSENYTSLLREGKIIHCSFTSIKRKIWAEYFISNTITNYNYGPLKEKLLIFKALEQSSQ